jgi:hypothetical protein
MALVRSQQFGSPDISGVSKSVFRGRLGHNQCGLLLRVKRYTFWHLRVEDSHALGSIPLVVEENVA